MKNKKKRSTRFDIEKEYGFRFVIHDRDWIGGRTIRANVVDSIDESRRVIFIISKYFLFPSYDHFFFFSNFIVEMYFIPFLEIF